MSKDNMTVMEKLIAACTTAHQARVPLILVDTEEAELMDRLAVECGLVDFFSTGKKGAPAENRYTPYYTFLSEPSQPLDACVNFTYSVAELDQMLMRNGSLEYSGGSLSPQQTNPGARPLPVMAVLHLSHTSWKQGGATRPSLDYEESLINFLRRYTLAYTRTRDLSSILRSSRVLLYGDPSLLPRDLLPYTEIVNVDYPQIWELKQIICRIAAENGKPVTSGNAPQQLAELMTGFGLIPAERFVRKLYWTDSAPGESPLDIDKYYPMLMEEKAKAIRSAGGLLELYFEKNPPKKRALSPVRPGKSGGLGGMKAYSAWVSARRDHMQSYADYASRRGVPALKGVLLCGVPGCGKSLAAKVLHREWGISMLRMDIDRLMGGLVGDSERNMRQALQLAEAMSPVILWIDEIEKGFAGASSSSNDGGTFKRMFGRLLTWMQENTKPCFIFATANDISQLPIEFFRSGRFDALFSVYMPTWAECKDIFKAQMVNAEDLRRKKCLANGDDPSILKPLFDADCFSDDCLTGIMDRVTGSLKPGEKPEELARRVKFLSGADIQKIVTTALAEIPEKDLDKPVPASKWLAALEKVIRNPSLSTQGSSSSNLDEIAACYVRLMRKNFTSVSDKSQILFRQEHYSCAIRDGKVKATYTGSLNPAWPLYDQALFSALLPRIQEIASLMENNSFHRLSM